MPELSLVTILIVMNFIYNTESSSFDVEYYSEIYNKFNEDYLINITDPNKGNCLVKIEEELNKNSFKHIIDYSGKSYSDPGLFHQCHAKNYSYFLFIYNRTAGTDEHVINFLRRTRYFYGLCIYPQCHDFFNSNSTITTIIRKLIRQEDSTVMIYPVKSDTQIAINNQGDLTNNNLYALIIAGILALFLLAKILVCIFRMTCEEDKRSKRGVSYGIENIEDSLNDSFEPESILIPDQQIPLFYSNQSKEQMSLIRIEERKNKMIKGVVRFLDLHENINILIDNKNQYYNDIDIELLSFIRSLTLFFMVLNHNFYSIIQLPIKNLNDKDFFISLKMILFKMSTFSVNSWIVMEGFILSFKFMSFAKKKILKRGTSSLPPKYLFLFYIKSFSKIISFIIVYILTSLGIDQFSILGVPPMFRFFIEILNKRKCTTDPLSIFNPFALLYLDYMNQSFGFTNCFKYVNICFNTHICFIFIIGLLCLSMQFRSKVFDLIILCLFLINLGAVKLTSNFNYSLGKTVKFSISYLMGETYSMKYTHLFINYYFIGVIGGMMYFYYFDIVSQSPLDNNTNYRPLFFCFHLMKSIDSLSQGIKTCVLIVSIGIMGLISITFWFFYDKKATNPLQFKITGIYQFIDMYEKVIFVFAMLVLIIIILFSKSNFPFKAFYSFGVFRFIDRLSFPIFCSMDNIIYLFYSTYYIVIVLNFNNIVFLALGLMFLLIITNCVIILTVDLPIKIITCLLTNRDMSPHYKLK